ncbi:MAG TPA: hypothetical protein VMR49_03960 [Candidatus Paceibacterota bacterium]|jgi:hypothetical protein|nr:hypothetical protein [Candidatus Paceibacterota bacterium]
MNFYLYIIITILGLSSYVVGIFQMFKNKYSPSTFTRIIWVLLSINSFAGVIFSNSGKSSILLGGIILIGSVATCIVSFWKGVKTIGKLEYFCIILLLISGVIWILFDAPLVNLGISLFAHFIGGIPTYRKIWVNPKSESISFWVLFFLASLLSIFATDYTSFKNIILPVYFTLFDGSMVILSLRKNKV